MAKSFDMADRYPSPAAGRQPAQRSKATGGGKAPLDPMGDPIPGWCAKPGQNPGDCPTSDCDFTPRSRSEGRK